jgi:6,7-dimethyl-8-ribityllumazine synthase
MIQKSAETPSLPTARGEGQVRVLIVEARFYSDLADELLRGATDALESFGASYDVVTVPGALEIPGAIAIAEEGGGRPAGVEPYDGYVALGTVIRGETYHFEVVSNESARGIMNLTVDKGLAVGNGVLTVEDEEQAWARARVSEGDKGGGAARAALTMIALRQQMLGAAR